MPKNYVKEVIQGLPKKVQEQIQNAPNGVVGDEILVRAIRQRREDEGLKPLAGTATTEDQGGISYLHPDLAAARERSRQGW